jgi:hypothetical protein
MEYIGKSAVKELLNETVSPKVTIYLPIHLSAAPPHITENQIRLKNLVTRAQSQLPKHGEGKQLSEELGGMLEKYQQDLTLWEEQTPGLLICASPGNLHMFHLTLETEEYVGVDDQYHLAPVLGLINDTRNYYVLVLAQKEPKLFFSDTLHIEPSYFGLPNSAKDALGIDEANQKSEQQASAGGAGSGRNSFNGRGGAKSPVSSDRERYFRLIDRMANQKLERSLPILLAGTETDIALFRQTSTYPKLMEAELHGNFTNGQAKRLLSLANPLVRQELIEPEHLTAIRRYEQLKGSNNNQVATDPDKVREAARSGRVETLLASLLQKTSDTVQDSIDDVLRITFPPVELFRSLNQLALDVWHAQGQVLCLVPQEMPTRSRVAASLRY